MVINKESATVGTEPYGIANQGNSTLIFTVTPTSIGVQRGNALATQVFHF
jgi:hypothetical protein